MSDDELQLAVIAELAEQPGLVAAHIGVTADNGMVTLLGQVDRIAQKRIAYVAASRVKGVKAVAEDLKVKLAVDTAYDDDDIAVAALECLSSNVSIPKDAVKASAEDGWVTLAGEVGRQCQKEAAEHDIRALMGVEGIVNRITIEPLKSNFTPADDVQHALHSATLSDSMTANVAALESRIGPNAPVSSRQYWQIATPAAWAAPGASTVENHIAAV